MKKWMYVIVPAILLAIFLVFYKQKMSELDERERQRAVEVAKQKAADDEHKRQVADKAREDSERHAAETAAETAKAEKEKEDKWNADGKKIQDQTDKATAEAAQYSKHASELETQLDTLNKQKEKLSREDFDLLKKVEQSRVAQHNAEMEIQRMVEMIAKRASESSLAAMPPTPPPAKR